MSQPKIERLLRLMRLLSGSVDYTIAEIGERLLISSRSVYRYIESLKDAGFSVVKLYGDVYKLATMPPGDMDLAKLVCFSEEEAYVVNSLIDNLSPTNSLRSNLKRKLSAIYDQTSITKFVDRRTNSLHVDCLHKAIKEKRKVILKNYESGHSHTIRDRLIEPYGFTLDYIDVCAFDLEDNKNKVFKIQRIGEVKIVDECWTEEKQHQIPGIDAFRMSGDNPIRVRLRLSLLAKNLLTEEFPLAEKDLTRQGDSWLLDTRVYSFLGIGRFYLGQMNEIGIVDSPEFEAYIISFLNDYAPIAKS
ncbi:MAG: WYL domain-containing protein [Bacteroidales bacterium]|nr:WYL domain-containing protein [Bacteroidales bacterium]